ncbi:MAG: glycosyl transferase, group 1 [Acidobacteria bacterium]|nr:glycosyl transferase, group 1 [Acidobacteriota bacterium]
MRRRRKLRIGVDIRPFYEPLTGIGWYLYHLLHELAKYDEVELYLFGDARITDEGPRLHAEVPANARLCTFDLRGLPQSRLARPLTAAAYVIWMKLADPDVFFAANYFLPRLHGSIARRRVIVVHDLTYKRFPELLQKETLENLSRTMQREIALADAIVCVSETTRQDLLQFYDVDRRRAVAILSGLGALPAPEPIDGLPPRYLLFVSTIEPRKNLPALLDAFERLRARGAYDGSLVVVGRIGWKSESLLPRLRQPGVVHLDYVNARQLATVYQNAEVFVFPSLYEGFGFPLLEAMSHGVPAIAARSSSLPEIGGDAALYFDPRNPAELESQLDRLLHDPALREELVHRGRQQVRSFRWDIAAKKTLGVLRRAAGGG